MVYFIKYKQAENNLNKFNLLSNINVGCDMNVIINTSGIIWSFFLVTCVLIQLMNLECMVS